MCTDQSMVQFVIQISILGSDSPHQKQENGEWCRWLAKAWIVILFINQQFKASL